MKSAASDVSAEPAARHNADSQFGQIMRIPVRVDIVVGSLTMPVASLMKLSRGSVLPLERRIGEPVDVVVNGRIVARGEIVIRDGDPADGAIGVSLTEIVSAEAGG